MIQGRHGPLFGTLKLRGSEASGSPALRSGETLAVRVLRAAAPGRWTVVVRGRALTASSDVPLTPGSVVHARVGREGSTIVLRLLPDAPGVVKPVPGLAGGATSQAISRALLASGLGVTAERVEHLHALSGGSGTPRDRRLRLAAEIIKKLPSLDSRGTAALTRLLELSDEEEGQGRRGRRHREARGSPDAAVTPASVRKSLWGQEPVVEGTVGEVGDRTGDLLRLFNHSKGGDAVWIVLPCRFGDGATEISGSVRILYDTVARTVRTVVLGAGGEPGPRWWFRLVPRGSRIECRLFCDGAPGQHVYAAELAALRAQLGNMGVAVADTVEDGARFDGFGPMDPSEPRPVDLLG